MEVFFTTAPTVEKLGGLLSLTACVSILCMKLMAQWLHLLISTIKIRRLQAKMEAKRGTFPSAAKSCMRRRAKRMQRSFVLIAFLERSYKNAQNTRNGQLTQAWQRSQESKIP